MAKPVLRKPKKKVCQFCKEKATSVDYKDTTLLRKFISDRGKIRARRVSRHCSQHQRDVAPDPQHHRHTAPPPRPPQDPCPPRERQLQSAPAGRRDGRQEQP